MEERVEMFISKDKLKSLLSQVTGVRIGIPGQQASEFARRVLQGLNVIEEAKKDC
jgi:hypothetical protein